MLVDVYQRFICLCQRDRFKGTCTYPANEYPAVDFRPFHGDYNNSFMKQSAILLLAGLMLSSCGSNRTLRMEELVEQFIYQSLAYSPTAATAAGYHSHKGVPLDQLLDDMSEQSLEAQRRFYLLTKDELRKIPVDSSNAEMDADGVIIRNQVELALLELNEIKSYKHNPTLYVEMIGNGLFSLYALESAPLEKRYQNIVARLEKIPSLLEQAKANLTDAPEIWNQVAVQENAGNIALIDTELRGHCPEGMRDNYSKAASVALSALKSFQTFLEGDLAKKTSDWRLGPERYSRKFLYSLVVDSSSGGTLTEAETKFKAVKLQMEGLARDVKGDVKKKLDLISKQQSSVNSYFGDARAYLKEARDFVKQANLVPLPNRDNLQVIETPEFMRGIYAVGGFNPAPALEPTLGAYYWLTPIPKDWPKERTASKLREYNTFGLRLLTLHEAMPGHYVQAEYANEVQPQSRRLLRSIYGNGPYVEGWAVYITEQVLDAGYLDKSPELRMTFLKQQLRMIANTILDVRLHTLGMTDEEAMTLMVEGAFQEEEEARAKLQRAKLSSCQLPTYYLGYREWQNLRERSLKGNPSQSLSAFHKKALSEGAVPMTELVKLMERSSRTVSGESPK